MPRAIDRCAERTTAVVDLGAVERNARTLAGRLLSQTCLCAVVKADGYGHGSVASARAAVAGGARWLAVATAGEADVLRRAGVEGRLLVLGALTDDELRLAVAHDADVVLWDGGRVEAIARVARQLGRRARVHVKHDSGMGRLGTRDPEQALHTASRAAWNNDLELVGLMTHLATADEPDGEFLGEQLARFAALAGRVRDRHPGILVHAANSAATLADPRAHFDMVRCGVALYGLDPFGMDATAHGLAPALSLRSYIASVWTARAGDSVGYGRTWTAVRPTRIATIPIGYGDGFRRAHSNNGDVLVGGRRHPVVGTVSMDNITVALRDEVHAEVGDPVVLLGRQGESSITAEELGRRLGTINYEITCQLMPRVPRRPR